jgi:hypothetical protein
LVKNSRIGTLLLQETQIYKLNNTFSILYPCLVEQVLEAAAALVAVEGEAADGGLARVCEKDNLYS